MKKILLILFYVMFNSVSAQSLNYLEEITINTNEGIIIKAPKSAADLSIENLSNEKVSLISSLKVPNYIMQKSLFSYVLPKKGYLYIFNYSSLDIIIRVKIESKRKFVIRKTKYIDNNQ